MSSAYDERLRKGALVNLLGLVGKLLFPLLFLIITWLCGPEKVGLYMLAVSLAEVAISAVQAGFVDAVMVYGSRHVDRAAHDPAEKAALYGVLGAGFGMPLVISVLFAFLGLFFAGIFVEQVYPDRPALIPALRIVGFTLPLIAISQACISATKAKMHMEYDALLNGFLRPVLLLGASVVFWKLKPELESLMWAQLVAYFGVTVFAVRGFTKHFEWRPLLTAMRERIFDREVLRFALPQSLNMTLNKYLGRLDVMMLGAMGHSDFELGLFGAAAMITINIREVKLIFSGALGPVVARHHAAKETDAFADVLSRVTRWSTTIAVPLVLVVACLRTDILRFVDRSYAQADNAFFLVLLIPPLLSTAFGLAGNCIVFTGHSRFNLLNSVLVAALNTGFCTLLIPPYGLMGAAIATALASSLITILQLVELKWLEGVGLRFAQVYKPHLGLVLGTLLLMAFWDPANLSGVQRAALASTLGVGFLVLMLLLRHEEIVRLAQRALRRP